jgi:hypothetical protein
VKPYFLTERVPAFAETLEEGNTEGRRKIMHSTMIAYIAGFLDGDGSIFFQLVKRKDYLYGYQIRCSVAFYQKTVNQKILRWLKSKFRCSYIRQRKTGISDYTIVEPKEVLRILRMVKPFVILKKNQVIYGIKILEKLPFADTPRKFLTLCEYVDRFEKLNYSKKRKISSVDVEKFLTARNFIVPVETSS